MVQIATQADQVTFHRAERKYQIEGGDLAYIRRVLRNNCISIEHEGRVSTNHTLYFEDAGLSSYHENKGGISKRWKSRVRWYNSGEKNVHFEFKERASIYSSKDRVKLDLPVPITQIKFSELKKIFRSQFSSEQYERFLYRSEPVLLNEYKREYFADPHSGIRLTLDYDIKCYDQTGRNMPAMKFAHHFPHLIILECKVGVRSTEVIERLLSPLRLRLSQSSKFVMCLEALNSY